MIITSFGDLKWGDERALQQFLAAHDLKHQALAQAVGRRGVTVPVFMLSSEIDDAWVQTHWQQHVTLSQQIVQNADTSTYSLLTNPMSDEDTFYDWNDIHDLIHQQLDQALGISGT